MKVFGSAQKMNPTAKRNRQWELGADIDKNGSLRIARLPGGSHHADGNKVLVLHQKDTTLNPVALDIIQEGSGDAIIFKNSEDDTTIGKISSTGAATPASSETIKHDFQTVPHKLIEKVLNKLSVKSWAYNINPDERLIGPTAEDYQEVTGYGDGKGVNSLTLLGFTILMVQFVWKRVQKLEAAAKQKETSATKKKLTENDDQPKA